MIGGRQLVQALDNAESIVVITDSTGVISFVNMTFEKVYGYSRREAIGLTPSILKSGYHSNAFYQELWETLTSGKSWHGDFINRGKNGDLIIEKASISPIFSDDGTDTIGFIAVKEDISIENKLREQLRLREQIFEKLFENSTVGILIMAPVHLNGQVSDFSITRANPRAVQIMGRSFLEAHSLKNLFSGQSFINKLCSGRERGDELLEWSCQDMKKSLQLRLFSISPEQDCLLISDVSRQKEMEIRLLESEAHLRKLNDTKDKFFSIIAHDLKNPFQVIIGFASLLYDSLESFSSEEIKGMVQKIISSSESTFTLLEDLLAWSKSQLGQLKPYPEKCEAQQLVGKAFVQLDGLASKKNIELINEIPETIYCHVDPDMLEFVLRNLIHNGIKFTPCGGSIRCWTSGFDGKVQINVEDNGIGIQPIKMKALFSLDDVLSTPGTSEESGTGLGLILIREMIELNKGQITVESVPGKGSCFSVILPSFAN